MKRTVSLLEFMPYGAPDLIAARRPHMALGLASTSLAAALLFAIATQIGLTLPAPTPPVDPGTIIDLAPPPPAFSVHPPPPPVTPAKVRPRIDEGILVPVPVHEAPPEEPPAIGGRSDGSRDGAEPDVSQSGILAGSRPVEELLPKRSDIVPVDELPVVVKEVKPVYPDLARDAGVEGLVIVHALVGKNGRVMRVELDDKRSIPMLDPYALEAAKRWVFTPAIWNGQPIPYWCPISFRFVLHE
jgi:protein TonB